MMDFLMNGYLWEVRFVDPYDPMLVDRTDTLRVATTDPYTLTVYLSDDLEGEFLNHVLIHELGHCTMFSFHLIPQIHRMVKPKYWVEMEEWVCNFIADYGMSIFSIMYKTLGEKAIWVVPYELEYFMKARR